MMDAVTFEELAARIAERVLAGMRVAPPPPPAVLSDTLTVDEFATAVGRSVVWVYRQIRARRVAVRKAGKPYQIPRAELGKFTKATGSF